MAEQTGGPTFEEFGDVEPNGSSDRTDSATKPVRGNKLADGVGRREPMLRQPERPAASPPPRSMSTPVWLLLVAFGAVLFTLAIVYVAFRVLVPAPAPASVAGVSVASTPIAPVGPAATPIAPVSQPPTLAPTVVQVAGVQAAGNAQPTAASAPSAACTTPLADAQSLAQARRWSDAAAKLEVVRSQCDVVGPLYDADLNQARALAEDERADEAIAFFDKALQVKNGTEAGNERALAVAYRDGRAALDGGDLDTAIANLSRVQSANANYARGNNTLNLINAYLAQGDQLVTQSKCAEALTYFQRADALKPNESVINQRISSTQQCGRPTLVPPPPAPVAVSVPAAPVAAPPLEPTVRAYYDAINSRRFSDAYSILSSSARATQSLATFAGRFDSTRGIGVRFIDGVSIQGSSAQLDAHTQTVTLSGTSLVTSCSRVAWVLIFEGGQWKRDVRSESGNEFAERC